MRKMPLSLQHGFRALVLRVLLAIAVPLPGYAALPAWQLQAPQAVLRVEAPAHVALGTRIEVQLIVDHAQDLAGYEAQLLFDTSAAHFSGFHQRDSDLKKFGRDVIPLEEGELPDGVTLGLASCPYQNCVDLSGSPQPKGANGRVRLGSVLIGTDRPGQLELRFDHLKFVDSSGNVIPVAVPQSDISVQVGSARSNVSIPAPASTWQWSTTTASTASNFDITGDQAVNFADAAEVALEWKTSREQGQPCGPANDLSRDTNGDGCIDVSDIQLVLANAVGRSQGPKVPAASAVPGTPSTAEGTTAPASVTATFAVDSTSDAPDASIGDGICATSAGECTLRAAINEANKHLGADRITFAIPGGGVHTIQLNSRLPSLWDRSGGTTIDGYSQPGAQPNTDALISNAVIVVQLEGNGASAFDALQITSSNNVVQGLAIFNARRSIWIYGSAATNNVVAGNFLGTNAAGTFGQSVAVFNASGIMIENGASNNQVGGTIPAQRNVLSGNARDGLQFNSDGTDKNVVYNNILGLNPTGTERLENLRHGIDMNAGPSYNIIGGTAAGQRNILSGNGEAVNSAGAAGIEISHDTLTSFNSVIGNCMGTDPSCTRGPSWAANRFYGIRLEDGVNNNTIAGNVIGNNGQGGIRITGSGTNRNRVYNNRIGVSLDNTSIPNPNFGIQIARSSKFNKIGPNNILANSLYGVQLLDAGTDRNTFRQNSIYNNGRLGIDLGTVPGVSPNDSGDLDTGTNEELNWPVLKTATSTQVTGTACSEAVVPKPCRIEVFIAKRNTSDSGGGNYGQGKTFVGAGTTNSNGSFAVTISGVTAGQYLTATATDAAGNTSEFSRNILVSAGVVAGIQSEDLFSRTVSDGWGSATTDGSSGPRGAAFGFAADASADGMTFPAAGAVDRWAALPSAAANSHLIFTFDDLFLVAPW